MANFKLIGKQEGKHIVQLEGGHEVRMTDEELAKLEGGSSGKTVSTAKAMRDNSEALKAAESKAVELEAKLAESDAACTALQGKLDEAATEIERLKADLAEAQKIATERGATIDGLVKQGAQKKAASASEPKAPAAE